MSFTDGGLTQVYLKMAAKMTAVIKLRKR